MKVVLFLMLASLTYGQSDFLLLLAADHRNLPYGFEFFLTSANKFFICSDGDTLYVNQNIPTYAWTEVTDSATTTTRDGSEAIYFSGKHWLFGGWNVSTASHNEIWNSTDAVTWDSIGTAAWQDAHTFFVCQIGDTLFKMGADIQTPDSTTYKSTDGITWAEISSDNGLDSLVLMGFILSPNKDTVFAYGGQRGLVGQTPDTTIVEDSIFISLNNGRTFTSVDTPPWTGGNMWEAVIYYDNRYWKVGGGAYTVGHQRAVYNSTDGISWTLVGNVPFTPSQYHQLEVFDNRLWVIGGYHYEAPSGDQNRVFYTTGGKAWIEVETTPWEIRHALSGWIAGSSLYTFGGTGAGNTGYKDVQKLTRTN